MCHTESIKFYLEYREEGRAGEAEIETKEEEERGTERKKEREERGEGRERQRAASSEQEQGRESLDQPASAEGRD